MTSIVLITDPFGVISVKVKKHQCGIIWSLSSKTNSLTLQAQNIERREKSERSSDGAPRSDDVVCADADFVDCSDSDASSMQEMNSRKS